MVSSSEPSVNQTLDLRSISGVEVTPSITSVESSEQFWHICEPWDIYISNRTECLIRRVIYKNLIRQQHIITDQMDDTKFCYQSIITMTKFVIFKLFLARTVQLLRDDVLSVVTN